MPVAFALALLATWLGLVNPVTAQTPDSTIGTVDFPISCSPSQQPAFNHAVALLHHMTYPQAKSEFETIAAADPDCAMAYWGIAMTLFQPLWPTRPGLDERMEGRRVAEKAVQLGAATERERLFIAAADSFFIDPESPDYWSRIHRWARATETLYDRYPTDHEAMAFHALGLLATAPAGGASLDHQNRAAELLLAIQRENPEHPGSFHYLIHANDVNGREHESLDLVDRYDEIAPDNPHALHMPTHIYTRLGAWDGVIEGNLRAAEAALAHPAGDKGQYIWDEFPHSLEYLVYAYLQRGDDDAAASQIERLGSASLLHPTFKTAFHLSSIPARFALERENWLDAANLPPRPSEYLDWDRFKWPEAITWFARGYGASELGDLGGAETALDKISDLEKGAEDAGEELFARQIRILRLAVASWLAQARNQPVQALALMQQAAELETSTPKHPVTPAPTIPAYELLGRLLMKQGDYGAALDAFRKSNALHPNRLNGLAGLARAADKLGDTETEELSYRALRDLCVSSSERAACQEAKMHRNGQE